MKNCSFFVWIFLEDGFPGFIDKTPRRSFEKQRQLLAMC